MLRVLKLALIFLSSGAFSSEVVKVGASQTIIAVSQNAQKPFRLSDSVCVTERSRDIACGVVIKLSSGIALVKLNQPSDLVARGHQVRLKEGDRAALPQERKPAAALMQSVPGEKEAETHYHNLSAGFSVGNGFYFPLLHFQRLIHPSIALGLMPSYMNVSSGAGSVTAVGGMLTFNYYGHEFFRGLWLQQGVGASLFSSSTARGEEQATSLSSLTTIGWRGYWDLGFNIGLCAGFQYLKDPNFTNLTLSGAGFQPLALIDVGFNF